MGKNQSINNVMEECRIVIWNASSDEIIHTRLEPFGFDEARHEANKTLFNETAALILETNTEHAEWRTACEAFNNSYRLCRNEFGKIRRSLKFWYDYSSQEAIQLNLYSEKISKYTDFVQTAKNFYTKLAQMPDVLAKLTPFGYTAESATQQNDALDNLSVLHENREKESGDAQYSTKMRNAKMDELYELVAEIKRLAKLIFQEEEAQYLEKLDVVVRS